jgi:hypothetical protein
MDKQCISLNSYNLKILVRKEPKCQGLISMISRAIFPPKYYNE